MLGVDLAPDRRFHRRRRRDVRPVGSHDFAAERLLLVRALHHVHVAPEPEKRARHRKRRAPLPGARLGRHIRDALRLGVVRLRNRAVELVRARGVVPLELVVDVRGRPERLLEEVGADQRRGTVHLVELEHLFRNREVGRLVVQLLPHALLAEDFLELLRRHGLVRRRIQHRRRLLLHVRPHVVPGGRQFVLAQIGLVGNLVHLFVLSFYFICAFAKA